MNAYATPLRHTSEGKNRIRIYPSTRILEEMNLSSRITRRAG
jgi:hypothetical protein